MKLGIIVGSHRKNSQSTRMAEKMIERWLKLFNAKMEDIFILDFGKTSLPFWDESLFEPGSSWPQTWGPISAKLMACEAFIVVSPEWNGMVPAALKNFFLLASSKELGHKPAMIAGVSSGRSGSYPVVELRMSGYKNTRILYVPDHMIFRGVEGLFLTPEPKDADEANLLARLDNHLKMLYEYGKALRLVRESGVMDWKNFSNGL